MKFCCYFCWFYLYLFRMYCFFLYYYSTWIVINVYYLVYDNKCCI